MATIGRFQRQTSRCAAPIALGVWAVVLFGSPIAVQAQERVVLPPAQSIEPHSMVDVRALAPTLPSAQRTPEKTVQVKPFRVPNPEALRQWKDAVERFPNLVRPPSDDVVVDPR